MKKQMDAGVKKNTAGGSWVAGVARTRLEVLAMNGMQELRRTPQVVLGLLESPEPVWRFWL
jgi:hypothetical protein